MAQLQRLGPAAPIQPVNLPSFQYGLANVRVGRSKLSDLADALAGVNPALEQFGRISLAKQKLEEEQRELQLQRGREAFALDPTGMSEKLKSVARKGAETGEIPEAQNVPFLIGGSQALGEVLVRRDYRAMLRDLVSDTVDVETTILQNRQAFLQRDEFSNPLVKSFILESLEDVEDEFRKNVQSRLDDVQIETNKRNWLELGRDSIGQAIAGVVDINDPSIRRWINHPVGIFKGARKFAWDNLIKEDLKEGLLTGTYTPSQVTGFLDKLSEWDIGGGVKYADAETGNAILEFRGYVEGQRAVLENKNKEKINLEYEAAATTASIAFFEEYKETGAVSEDTLKTQIDLALEKVPYHKRDALMADIMQSYSRQGKLKDEATVVVFASLNNLIEDGTDTDVTKGAIQDAYSTGSITAEQYDKLNTRLENSRDFDIQVLKNPSYIDLKADYNELITGFKRVKGGLDLGFDPGTLGYFQTITLDKNPKTDDDPEFNSIYKQIKDHAGESKAKMFVNRQYRAFDRSLRGALENEFNKIIAKGNSTEQARDLVEERQDDIAQKLFDTWVDDSITVANTMFLTTPK
jgi:hypothetical protein|tara:strand:+ start:7370 stop:9106 length:1737 start_codon:yes stop_codon:yes gene_type:complete